MTVEASLWVSVGGFVASEVPDDESFVAATGQEHVWAVDSVSNLLIPLEAGIERTSPRTLPAT